MSSDKKIYLTGHLDVPEERWEHVLKALPQHIELTRAEPGCLKFEVEPSEDVKYRLLVSETFENRAMFEAHGARMKGTKWAEVTDGIARHYQVKEG